MIAHRTWRRRSLLVHTMLWTSVIVGAVLGYFL